MTEKNIAFFLFSFHMLKTQLEVILRKTASMSEASQPRIQDSSNGKVVESWPDLEMNLAQAYCLFRLHMLWSRC